MAETLKRKKTRPQVFGITNDQCVWSRAGVVKPMKCVNAFDWSVPFSHNIINYDCLFK